MMQDHLLYPPRLRYACNIRKKKTLLGAEEKPVDADGDYR